MKGPKLKLLYFSILLMDILIVGCEQNSFLELKEEIGDNEVADILISEILPDPKKDGVEFVEIFNNSNKVIDLNSLQLASVNATGKRSKLHPISKTNLMIYPFTYKLLSLDSEKIKAQYPVPSPLSLYTMSSFPTLTNSQGAVLLIRHEKVIDSLYYELGMHNVFIKNSKGVSLERVSFKKTTNSPGNFISAAASNQYATPGYENSQLANEELLSPSVFLSSRTFAPDQGEQLTINFHLQANNMTNISIYNKLGKKVYTLLSNHILGTKDCVFWNGEDENKHQLPIGLYHLYIEIYNSKGNFTRYKESFIIASKVTV